MLPSPSGEKSVDNGENYESTSLFSTFPPGQTTIHKGIFCRKNGKFMDLSGNYVSDRTGNFIPQNEPKSCAFRCGKQENRQPPGKGTKIFVYIPQFALWYEFFLPGNTVTIFISLEGVCKGKWKSAV